MIKMVICDIDGTLIRNVDKEIPGANVAALKKLQEKGILVTLATGRVPGALRKYAQELNITKNINYVIGANGGAVYNIANNTFAYDEKATLEDTKWAMELVKELGADFYLAPIAENLAYVSSQYVLDNNLFYFDYKFLTAKIIDWNNIPQMRKVVVATSDHEKQNWLRQQVAVSETLRTEKTGYGYIEIIPKNVNKWEGIIRLLEILRGEGIDIATDEILCFGDQMNDYEMIKNAKYGVALSNATAELKEVAWKVTALDNNNAGIADFLEKEIFPHLGE
ncbi:Cof-like hydrolase [Spiroplasma syrphidicola EA-1]|uniref:Cof-like hydrolase n=1 Tax=Spiroplasma syrphidicola EA-1 TaxID=1276229 RepID=R4U572_9MOLU|nr:HAD family hydrolase [Spiroplasma syrphidicola]AGM25708.1 Cof-like hydrolase [Spiroplasma syrphidicola EA-1]